MYKKGISVIIKTYNEEDSIEDAITSAQSLKPAEIIVSDTGSTDSTLDIASGYDVRIIKLKDKKLSNCSIGATIGFYEVKHEYTYLMDGDMTVRKEFVEKAIKLLKKEKDLAAVGGLLPPENTGGLMDDRYGQKIKKKPIGYVDYIEGGGLYRSSAIAELKYFTHPFLHSYEESDLGYRLKDKGYKIKRIDEVAGTHSSYSKALPTLFRKFFSGYMLGAGEVIRYNPKRIIDYSRIFYLYYLTIFWWIALVLSIAVGYSYEFIGISLIFFALLTVKKSLGEAFYSVVSWNLTAISMIAGFFTARNYRKVEYEK